MVKHDNLGVKNLGLDGRITNLLIRNYITTVGELCKWTVRELEGIHQIGAGTVAKIQTALADDSIGRELRSKPVGNLVVGFNWRAVTPAEACDIPLRQLDHIRYKFARRYIVQADLEGQTLGSLTIVTEADINGISWSGSYTAVAAISQIKQILRSAHLRGRL